VAGKDLIEKLLLDFEVDSEVDSASIYNIAFLGKLIQFQTAYISTMSG
jgi:hypothetical protein